VRICESSEASIPSRASRSEIAGDGEVSLTTFAPTLVAEIAIVGTVELELRRV